jgi:hypothetical protein
LEMTLIAARGTLPDEESERILHSVVKTT